MKTKTLSLRYKLLFLLVTLPLVCLAAYLVLAVHLFEADKIAYIFDSNAMAARSLATQSAYEIKAISKRLREEVLRTLNSSSGVKPKLSVSASPQGDDFKINKINVLKRNPQVPVSQVALELVRQGQEILWKGQVRKGAETHVFEASIDAPVLSRLFEKASSFSSYLISPKGQVLFASSSEKVAPDFAAWKWFQGIQASKIQQGTSETVGPTGEPMLGAYASVGSTGLRVVTLINKSDALKAIQVLLVKSILFFIALVSLSIVVSVFVSKNLTSALRKLFEATKQVSQGDFNVRVKIDSKDEVESLGNSFNTMAAEVSRLMSETADKARMEKELETARTVQETLFPEAEFSAPGGRLKGYYMPASECGGDWWYHMRIGSKLYVWVGDATGHGAPAALMTSAARSAASVVESFPNLSPALAMKHLNRAIRQTSKGTILMTFFIASIDLETGELTYANASHDPPFLLRRLAETRAFHKGDLEPLNDVNSPRLGEEEDFDYQEAKVSLKPGDNIVFYTDGVADVPNAEGVPMGNKKFIASTLKALSEKPEIANASDSFWNELNDYRGTSVIPDDVTVIYFRYSGEKNAA